MNTPEHMRNIAGWLNDLSTLTAGRMPVEEARERMAAYAVLLADEFDPPVFCRKSIATVARVLKWFPSYGELHALLTEFRDQQDDVDGIGRMTLAQIDAYHSRRVLMIGQEKANGD